MKRGTWAIAGIAAAGVVLVAPVWAQDAAAAPDFATFLGGVKVDAAARGIRPETVDAAFADVQPIPKVIEYDRRQPEFTLSFDQYMSRVVSPAKVAKGRKMMAENRALLAEIEKKYGVQARFVAALWGIETDYGRVTGGYPVIASLATLAWDGRRSTYFRGELINALKILDEGHIAPQAMVGSWAGAMGQCQFMPSTFVKWSVDGNGDGRRDVWTNRADALASAANYLAGEGWKGEETWGRAVRLPDGFDIKMTGLDTRKSLAEWSRLGVKAANGKPLPKRSLEASIILAEAGKGPAFLVYDNFRTIMKWNRSTFFALAAGHLADKIGGR